MNSIKQIYYGVCENFNWEYLDDTKSFCVVDETLIQTGPTKL